MTHSNNLTTQPAPTASLAKLMLIGAVINFIVIALFLSGVPHANPEWGKFWMVRPLMVVPLAGATGGACFYFISSFFYRNGWSRAAAIILSLIVFFIGLWLGTVLGLAGTLWH